MDNYISNEVTKTTEYICSLSAPLEGALGVVQRNAEAEGLPIIQPETAAFLDTLLLMQKPVKALEIGCCVGFSAGLIARRLSPAGRLLTIDRYDYMIQKARQNFSFMGISDRVDLLEGHAQEILPLLTETFDFVFVDAAKAQYGLFLREIIRLTKKGSLIVFDDVLKDDIAVKDRFEVERRQRTQHRRMRYFLWQLTHSEGLSASIVPIGHGIALCYRTGDEVILNEEKTDEEF